MVKITQEVYVQRAEKALYKMNLIHLNGSERNRHTVTFDALDFIESFKGSNKLSLTEICKYGSLAAENLNNFQEKTFKRAGIAKYTYSVSMVMNKQGRHELTIKIEVSNK